MEYYISTFIFSSGVIQGILLLFALLRKRSNLYPNIFLGIFIAVITLQVLIKFLDIFMHPGHLGPMYDVSYYLPYLYGPLLYLYIKKSLDENFTFKTKALLHFLPFILSVIIVYTAGYNMINLFDYVNVHVYNIADTGMQIISLTSYVFICRKLVNNKAGLSAKEAGSLRAEKWLKDFSNIVWITGITVIILFTLVFYKIEFYNIKFNDLGAAFILLPATIYWLSYSALVKPEFFTSGSASLGITAPAVNNHVKYQNNQLTGNEIEGILASLNTYMENEKAYLNPELSLEMLSKSVNIPRHHISQAINLKLDVNFNDYVNLQRIENAKKELLNPAKQHLTIAAIAFESGFNSISTFNEAFKKNTSMTPSEFKKRRFNP